MTTAADLERIVNQPTTKAARARALIELGCDRTDVVELLGVSYSQAHSAYKEVHGGLPASKARRSGPSRSQSREGQPETAGQNSARRLNLRPTQTRLVTQDGHVVYRDLDGKHCTDCEKSIGFSIKYLGFIHEGSKSEPTKLEDHYAT